MPLPDPLLLSDLLACRVRCDRGEEHGVGQAAWMHPPVHRLLGWVSRPSALSARRCVWRLDQLRSLAEGEALVQGEPSDTDAGTVERLPTLLGAVLLSGSREPLGRLVDAAVERRTGRILHYLVARSDPRLPGGSRWRLSPERIVDQRSGEVATALEGLADLPLARASLRETLLNRSRRWRDQWGEETSRLRDQWQHASGRFEERLEGWLEEPPWEESRSGRPRAPGPDDIWPEESGPEPSRSGWDDGPVSSASQGPREDSWPDDRQGPPPRRSPRPERFVAVRPGSGTVDGEDPDADAWDDEGANDPAPWSDGGADRRDGLRARRGRPAVPPGEDDDPWV